MSVSFGCRFCTFTWNIKHKANVKHIYRMYVCNRKNKTNLRAVHNTFNVWPLNNTTNRVVLVSISGLNANVNLNACPSISLPLPTTKKRIFDSVVWAVSVVWDFLQTLLKGIQLICTFTPLLLLYPLTKFSRKFKSTWYKMLLIGIGLSGPIIIKLGQWASTRRDLFSEELCFYLAKLQRKTTPHSWYYTNKCFEYAYGPKWQDIFVAFENEGQPIGSGCCAQVYKAWINKEKIPTTISSTNEKFQVSENFFFVEVMELLGFGYFSKYSIKPAPQYGLECLMPVAVKVRHPQMERQLRQDLNILKFLASTITQLIPSFKWLSLCECVDEFSQVMKSQVNFHKEAENLKKFASHFKDLNTVKFPCPLDLLTRSNILVETFEEGQHIEDFIAFGVSNKKRSNLAHVGVNTILKMVFEDNFIHGDLHPGNMLVQARDADKHSWKLSSLPWLNTTKDTLVILDCGIVATLDDRGKKCLKDVFAAVAHADGEKVAELFLHHSNHQCNDIPSFKEKMKEIVESAVSKHVTLHQVDVSVLMNSLFSTMIRYKVKVDSSFSSVILAIMVLEGLGRSLDPTIDILERAKPFLFASAI